MPGRRDIQLGEDYQFDGDVLSALSENGRIAMQAAMEQPVFPFTLAVFDGSDKLVFKQAYPIEEAERILVKAGSYWVD